jgi:hypothetical protein
VQLRETHLESADSYAHGDGLRLVLTTKVTTSDLVECQIHVLFLTYCASGMTFLRAKVLSLESSSSIMDAFQVEDGTARLLLPNRHGTW